jgi:hypothetical protein
LDGIREHGITQWHRRSYGICKTFEWMNESNRTDRDRSVIIIFRRLHSSSIHYRHTP